MIQQSQDVRTQNPGTFEQHPLPPGGSDDYEVTRRFRIVATGKQGPNGPGEALDALSLMLLSLDPPPGALKSDKPWEELVAEMLSPGLIDRGNPLDFAIFKRSRIALQLMQPFFRFSTTYLPLTTKKSHGNGKYYDLRLHMMTDAGLVSETLTEWQRNRPGTPCFCISLSTKDPDHHSDKKKDGFSMNVDLFGGVDGVELVVPITIDPDIENKGGNIPLEDDA